MLNAVIRFSLHHRSLIVVACLVALGYGAYLTATMPIDVFPDLNRPRVTIMTEGHGLSAEEVETLVTFPIESAVLGASGVRDVRTQSAIGLSSVVVEFDWGVDHQIARQIVQERLATVLNDLPPDVRPADGAARRDDGPNRPGWAAPRVRPERRRSGPRARHGVSRRARSQDRAARRGSPSGESRIAAIRSRGSRSRSRRSGRSPIARRVGPCRGRWPAGCPRLPVGAQAATLAPHAR